MSERYASVRTSQKPPATSEQSELELLLAAYQVRISRMHSRLMATLDALDVLQHTRAQEQRQVEMEQDSLMQSNHQMKQSMRAAIHERDDLRDLVATLVEKVESTNSLSGLSQSQILVTSLVDPMGSEEPRESTPRNDRFGPSLTKTLSLELAEERAAHRRTRQDAATQIALLKAQLARREAELATRMLEEPKSKKSIKKLDMTPDQAAAILEQASHDNKRLEHEVQLLAAQLGKGKAKVKSSDDAQIAPAPSKRRSNPAADGVIQDLEWQISNMNANVDELTRERYVLAHINDLDRPPAGKAFETVLLIEEECISLRARNAALEKQLQRRDAKPSQPEDSTTLKPGPSELPPNIPPPYLAPEDLHPLDQDMSFGDLRPQTPTTTRRHLLPSPPPSTHTRLATPETLRLKGAMDALSRARGDIEARDLEVATLKKDLLDLQRRMR